MEEVGGIKRWAEGKKEHKKEGQWVEMEEEKVRRSRRWGGRGD